MYTTATIPATISAAISTTISTTISATPVMAAAASVVVAFPRIGDVVLTPTDLYPGETDWRYSNGSDMLPAGARAEVFRIFIRDGQKFHQLNNEVSIRFENGTVLEGPIRLLDGWGLERVEMLRPEMQRRETRHSDAMSHATRE